MYDVNLDRVSVWLVIYLIPNVKIPCKKKKNLTNILSFFFVDENSRIQSTSFKKVRSSFYCGFPFPVGRYDVATVTECAQRCMRTDACYYFNVKNNVIGALTCDVTSINATASDVFNVTDPEQWTYYTVL